MPRVARGLHSPERMPGRARAVASSLRKGSGKAANVESEVLETEPAHFSGIRATSRDRVGDRAHELVGARRIDRDPDRPVGQSISAAVAIAADQLAAARGRLEEDDAEALLAARHHE